MEVKQVKQIAVICPYGIGNLILALPALLTLRHGFPKLDIHLISLLPTTTEILKSFPRFNELYDYLHPIYLPSGPKSFLRSAGAIRRIRNLRLETSLILFPSFSFHYNLLNILLGARTRFGWVFPDSTLRDLHWLNTRVLPVQERLHDVEQNLNMVRAIGEPEAEFSDLSRVQAIFSKEKKPLIGIHTGCKAKDRHKQWASSNFAEVIYRLLIMFPSFSIRLFFGHDEMDQLPFFRGQTWAKNVDFVHSLDLLGTLRKIEECSVFLSNDSGLMHMAVLCGCPHVIAVIGPSDPRRCGPFDPDAALLKADLSCMPCSHSYSLDSRKFNCQRNPVKECLFLVAVDAVIEAVEQAVGHKNKELKGHKDNISMNYDS